MNEDKLRLGFALCGSYCTYAKALPALERAAAEYGSVVPIMSENSYSTDTRFGKAEDFIRKIEEICGRPVVRTIAGAEPIGPEALLDVLVIAPCTGNTLAKIANGITDSSVTMACKAHLRNGRPVVLAIFTNDGLSGNAVNLGALLNRKNIFFVPFYQDDPGKKPNSLAADLDRLEAAVEAALRREQLQPLLIVPG